MARTLLTFNYVIIMLQISFMIPCHCHVSEIFFIATFAFYQILFQLFNVYTFCVQNRKINRLIEGYTIDVKISVTRLGNLLDFGQPFKAFANN